MDGISNQIIAVSTELQAARVAQGVDAYVLKQTYAMQQVTADTLLQPVTGSQTLASSGSIGTQLNELV